MIDEDVIEQIPNIISGRSAAFFDLDGTMARGHMIFDFPAHLMDAGLFGMKALEAEKFVEGRMGKVFHYSKGLVKLMGASGRPAVAISGSPVETVRALARRLGLDASSCFGFGDTEQDISFLGGVGHPVALNPSAELKTIALSKGWRIFDNTQDIVSEIEKLLGNADAVQG